MKLRVLLTIAALLLSVCSFAQKTWIELTFTATNNGAYTQLDSIKVMNRTQGGDTVLFWSDTILILGSGVGLPEYMPADESFRVFQNYPNPVADQTRISLFVPEKDEVFIMITDLSGREIYSANKAMDKGIHSFTFTPSGNDLYFFTARWRNDKSSIKILRILNHSGKSSSLEYLGNEAVTPALKEKLFTQAFLFNPGDQLLYIGYANGLQTGIPDAPLASETYTFQFATSIPCPGTPTVTYEGQLYNTIQIFSQCWLKENLNVGTMINGDLNQSDNGVIEKYCFLNEPDSCAKYGGLYQWDEMMQYATQQGTQGICPAGWHLPTDEEWKVLEGSVDSQHGIGDPVWDINLDYRGFNAGHNLKTTTGWIYGYGADLFGFSGRPGGQRTYLNTFAAIGSFGFFWTSTEDNINDSWLRWLNSGYPGIRRDNFDGALYAKQYGYSVRCIKDF